MSATDAPTAGAPPAGGELPSRPEVPSWKLVVTLTVAGALAAFALSFVYEMTLPAIEANKARVLEEAIAVVLKDPAEVMSLRVTADGLEPDDEIVYRQEKDVQRVFFGWREDGAPIGFALVGAAYGYGSDPIVLIFGYDPETSEVLGLSILEHKETPGIGTKMEDDPYFEAQWWRPVKPGTRRKGPRRVEAENLLVGVRSDAAPSSDPDVEPHEVDTISGATISSKAVVKVVNEVVGALGDKLVAPEREEAR